MGGNFQGTRLATSCGHHRAQHRQGDFLWGLRANALAGGRDDGLDPRAILPRFDQLSLEHLRFALARHEPAVPGLHGERRRQAFHVQPTLGGHHHPARRPPSRSELLGLG